MQSFFNHCIFCFRPLSHGERKSDGEHVIPEFLHGSLCIKDVCPQCNSLLGSEADHLALEDERIIAASFALDLPELQNRIIDRGKGVFVDEEDRSERAVKFKGGKPRIVPRKVRENLLETDEKDAPTHLRNILARLPPKGLKKGEIEKLSQELMWRYENIEPGESVHEPRLDMTLRKLRGEIKHQFKTTPNAAHRLIAKIALEFSLYAFNRDRLVTIPALDEIYTVALNGGELRNTTLMYPISPFSPVVTDPKEPKYFHQIILYYGDVGNLLDIYFFGCVGFRLSLREDDPSLFGPMKVDGKDVSMISILMTFEPNKPKERYLFSRTPEDKTPREWNATTSL